MRPPVYDYRPLDQVAATPKPPLSYYVRRYGVLALGGAVLVLVVVLAFMSVPSGETGELSDEEIANLVAGRPAGTGSAQEAGAVTTGLSVITFPTGANIDIEFEPSGVSPLDPVALEAGSYFVTLSKPGFATVDTLVFVDPGRVSAVYAVLRPDDGSSPQVAEEPRAEREPIPQRSASRDRASSAPPPSTIRRRNSAPGGTRAAEPDEVVTPDEPVRRASAAPLRRRAVESTVGTVRVATEPSGATVLLDGQAIGTTPTTLQRVTPGEYTLSFEREGFATHSQRVRVVAGEEEAVQAQLRAAVGRLVIVARPWGSIYIDGKLHRSDTDVQYETEVAAGTHTVRVTHPRLGVQERSVDVAAGTSQRLVIDLN